MQAAVWREEPMYLGSVVVHRWAETLGLADFSVLSTDMCFLNSSPGFSSLVLISALLVLQREDSP